MQMANNFRLPQASLLFPTFLTWKSMLKTWKNTNEKLCKRRKTTHSCYQFCSGQLAQTAGQFNIVSHVTQWPNRCCRKPRKRVKTVVTLYGCSALPSPPLQVIGMQRHVTYKHGGSVEPSQLRTTAGSHLHETVQPSLPLKSSKLLLPTSSLVALKGECTVSCRLGLFLVFLLL